MAGKKRFRLFDAILSVICVVFVAEAAAPAAAIGNSQYFWWIFLIIAFLLPYGFVVSELGTTYDDEGGLYDWVRRAFGANWGSRVSWYYWVNFPLWMASLAILFPETINILTGGELGVFPSLIIELAFIWSVVFLSFSKVSDSKWIMNAGAVLKVLIALALGGFGIYSAVQNGFANEYTLRSLLPSADVQSLSYLSIILFNFMGFEVITSFTPEMENPSKEIPKAIIAGGLAIAAIYLFSSFGIGVAIPTEEIAASSGLLEAVSLTAGPMAGVAVPVIAVVFLLTLFGNMVSWSYGVNYVACHAAKKHDMPSVFAIESKKNGMPIGASVVNGIVASILVIIAPLLPSQDLFWSFFALNVVMLLLSYVAMFPAFIRLRKIDPDRPRPFKVKGGEGTLKVISYLPAILLILAIIATAVPLENTPEEMAAKIPILVGTVVALLLGEVVRVISQKKAK